MSTFKDKDGGATANKAHSVEKKTQRKLVKKIGKKVKKGKRGGEVEKKLTYKASSSQEIDVSQRKKMAEALQNIKTDRWTDRQTDGQTDRQTDRPTDRWTN